MIKQLLNSVLVGYLTIIRRRRSDYWQWRSQGHNFGGARAILGGSGGMLPGKFGNLEYRKCDFEFLHFAGEILQKKILLLRITHSYRPPLNFSSDFIFHRGGPSAYWGG